MSGSTTVINSNHRRYASFDVLLSFSQLCGFTFVILSGYLLNTMDYGMKWPMKGNNGGLNFHGMFMSTGMVFFQGEALLSYRIYSYESKLLSKFVQVVFHVLAMGFFCTAIVAVIIQKNTNAWSHFTSAHSWIGAGVMFIFVVQFLLLLVIFIVPGVSDEMRETFMPIHRIVGSLSFGLSTMQATIGYIQYNSLFNKCPASHDAPFVCDNYRLVLNFIIISAIFYAAAVLILLVLPTWRRNKTREEMQ